MKPTTTRFMPLAIAAGLATGLASVHAAPTADAVLQHTATQVITRNYVRLADSTDRLGERLQALPQAASPADVVAARSAWRLARVHWETGEAHLFGPADTDGHDPAMDSWPLDQRELVALLEGSASVDAAAVASLDADVKGFHAIEFLLWNQPVAEGRESAEAAAERLSHAPRQRELLAALGSNLQGHARTLAAAWQGEDGHAKQIATAGTSASRLYPATSSALQELAEGIDGIVDELAAEKLGEPLASGRFDAVESPYARNTRADMRDNIDGIRNLWLGSLDGTTSGDGLRALAAQRGADVTAVDRALVHARGRIQAIGETADASGQRAFAEVIASGEEAHKARIRAAVDAVRQLQTHLASALE